MLPSRLRADSQSRLRSSEAGEHSLTANRNPPVGPRSPQNQEGPPRRARVCVRYTSAFTRYTCAALANNLAADTPFRAGCG